MPNSQVTDQFYLKALRPLFLKMSVVPAHQPHSGPIKAKVKPVNAPSQNTGSGNQKGRVWTPKFHDPETLTFPLILQRELSPNSTK